MVSRFARSAVVALLVLAPVSGAAVLASEWPSWRGLYGTGVSPETGLVASWSKESGENLVWRADFTGRSTPVVMRGKVFVNGRAGEGVTQREVVAAFDAGTGKKLWEHVISTALTTVPFNRAGWASLEGDLETGYVYAQGVAGPLVCYDENGNVVWQRDLAEELGRYSGYGGRTASPLVDEDRLIVSIINTTWGPLGPPRHRYYAFDKKTGEVLWISTPGSRPADLNVQAHGMVAVIGGRRLFIAGNADGHVYALMARTGEKVWEFDLAKGGLNSTPVVVGDTVFVGHSLENVDDATRGRVVAIDATGNGVVTKTHEKWRRDIAMGFPTALVHEGRVYALDNSANLHALDAQTGETLWELGLGTVGKGSPVWADGRIYVTETNGKFHVVKPGDSSAEILDTNEIGMPDADRHAEIYGSPAIAYGRIYFTTEEGVYALGRKDAPFEITAASYPSRGVEAEGSGTPAVVKVVPGDSTVRLGDDPQFRAVAFNEVGRPLGQLTAQWTVEGLQGTVDGAGKMSLAAEAPAQAGLVKARVGELEAAARVRVFGDLPYVEDFESVQGRGRPYWIGAGRFQVVEQDGGKVLEKPVAPSGLLRSTMFLGPDDLADYSIQADVMGNQQGRRRTDVGLVANGYILDLQGNAQKLQIRSWSAMLRMAQIVDFSWEMGKWYVMKLQVDQQGDKALVRGKVWPRGESEPADWTITAEDPLPVASGAPGVIGYSPASIYFDNIQVRKNQP